MCPIPLVLSCQSPARMGRGIPERLAADCLFARPRDAKASHLLRLPGLLRLPVPVPHHKVRPPDGPVRVHLHPREPPDGGGPHQQGRRLAPAGDPLPLGRAGPLLHLLLLRGELRAGGPGPGRPPAHRGRGGRRGGLHARAGQPLPAPRAHLPARGPGVLPEPPAPPPAPGRDAAPADPRGRARGGGAGGRGAGGGLLQRRGHGPGRLLPLRPLPPAALEHVPPGRLPGVGRRRRRLRERGRGPQGLPGRGGRGAQRPRGLAVGDRRGGQLGRRLHGRGRRGGARLRPLGGPLPGLPSEDQRRHA
mmetsp:Transcript_107923/g.315564  ORF Transcript_107923/g.315564 Transcript_107923/m.315564 type:complete len:305 (-) Transcript_107923:261-1175(-)